MQPIELPMMASGTMPRASRSRSAPTWWAPRAAPPPRMKTRFCRLAIADAPSYIGGGHACNPDPPRARRRRAPMLMLIDYSSLLFRSFHTIPESVPMHAVYGFLNMLARLVTDRRPDRLGIAVDEDWRPAFRVEALPAYKAHRVSDEPDPIAPEEAPGRGVPGIGEKTAARLIAAHGSLANVLAAKTLPPAVARRLEAAEPYLAAACRVVPPVAEVPLPPLDLALPKAPRHPRTLARLAREHELATPVGRVEKALAAVGRA